MYNINRDSFTHTDTFTSHTNTCKNMHCSAPHTAICNVCNMYCTRAYCVYRTYTTCIRYVFTFIYVFGIETNWNDKLKRPSHTAFPNQLISILFVFQPQFSNNKLCNILQPLWFRASFKMTASLKECKDSFLTVVHCHCFRFAIIKIKTCKSACNFGVHPGWACDFFN